MRENPQPLLITSLCATQNATTIVVVGSINLTSNVYLVLAPGGVLQGSADPKMYLRDWDYWHLINTVNVSNTGIIGLHEDSMGGEIRGPM